MIKDSIHISMEKEIFELRKAKRLMRKRNKELMILLDEAVDVMETEGFDDWAEEYKSLKKHVDDVKY